MKIIVKKGGDYNRTKIQKEIDLITDDDMLFKGDYEIELKIKKRNKPVRGC